MNINEFKKMLKEIPTGSTMELCFYLCVFLGCAYLPFSDSVKAHKLVFTDSSYIAAVIFIIVAMIFGTGIVRAIKWRICLKNNGKESISRLESRGLLEAAVNEINNSLRLSCPAYVPRGMARSNFSGRENLISDNFLYILMDNVVLTFDEVARFEAVRYQYIGNADALPDDLDIYYLTTISGKRYALIAHRHNKHTQEQLDLVNEVIAMLKEKNPNCCIDMTMKFYKSGIFKNRRIA